ncbi:hypothetical protein [Aureitalea marina]|uniref:Uncharacterized protein n=1 Tax=Aureitalea marina TaxID=930804 RepID=A0A2S7KR83_9FLAO|nr:hypothetical protein [Aureitalea marina]PQB05098.1 hypothetical protein BST85_09480 [Aureitalea marina]
MTVKELWAREDYQLCIKNLKLALEEDILKRLNAGDALFDFDYSPEDMDWLQIRLSWDDLKIPLELNFHFWDQWEVYEPDSTSKWNVEEYKVGEVEGPE